MFLETKTRVSLMIAVMMIVMWEEERCLVEAAINAQGEMFLRSRYAEIGVSLDASFNTLNPAPAGFHPQSPSGALGLMFDRFQDDNWTSFVGDFSLSGPSFLLLFFSSLFLHSECERLKRGIPTANTEHRFGLSGASTGTTMANGLNHGSDIPTTSPLSESVSDRIGSWTGRVNMLGTTLEITREWDGQFAEDNGIKIKVTIQNVGLQITDEEVIFFESINPDNDAGIGGSAETTNSVSSQGSLTTDGVPYWEVKAVGQISGSDSSLFFTSYDSRSVVTTDLGLFPSSGLDVIGGPSNIVTDDVSIGIGANLGSFLPLQTKVFEFYLGFGIPPTESICSNTPRLKCSASFTISTPEDECSAALHYRVPSFGTCLTGFIPLAPLSILPLDSVQPVGTYDLSFSGLGETCSFSVTIADNSPPTAVCPATINLNPDAGTCRATVSDLTDFVTVEDNCALDLSSTIIAGVGSSLSLGTHPVSFTFFDESGNAVVCASSIVVSTPAGGFLCDSDGDGINDDIEGSDDLDGDGTPNYLDTDSDGDGIDDIVETIRDSDGDNVPNAFDSDSDNDGIIDLVETSDDQDGDGIPNFLDLDSDNDGVSDLKESGYPLHNNRDVFKSMDTDGDGVVDEVDSTPFVSGTLILTFTLSDTDSDSDPDFLDLDSDDDTIFDMFERAFLPPSFDLDRNGRVDGADQDGDGIPNKVDTCNCFGGMSLRTFSITRPVLNAKWLMYKSAPIQWAHNLNADFTHVRIDIVSVSTSQRMNLFDRQAIGSNNLALHSINWAPSRILPGHYVLKFGVYSGSTFVPDLFTSSPFVIAVR